MSIERLKELIGDNKKYIESCLKIVNKDGELIPFKLNMGQNIVNDIISELERKNKPVRLIILKARQLGISTYTEGYIYKKTTTQKFKKGAIIAHLDEASQNLYNMYKTYYENTPEILKPMKKYLNSELLQFENPTEDEEKKKANPGLMSSISIKTAKNSKTGRSQTIQYLHASEVAFWQDAKTLMTGLMQTIPNKPNTAVIIESTANGIGDYFYDMWDKSVKGENNFIAIFLPWYIDPNYSLEFDSEEEKELFIKEVNELITDETGNKIHTEEYYLIEQAEKDPIYKKRLTYEQLNWRKWCIANNCNGDVEQFQQEYPSTADEAFIASGRPRFNISKLKKYIRHTEGGTKGFLNWTPGGGVVFEPNDKGYLEVWNFPKPNVFYCMGVDVAEGLKHGDYSCGIVGNSVDLKVDCMFHGHIDPDIFGEELVKLGKFYNNAYMGIESNNHGLTTIRAVQRLNYHNIYFMKTRDQITDRITSKIGWNTNSRTKPLLIDKLAEYIREGYLGIKSKLIVRELLTYVIEDNGSTNAQQGCNDDTVMALGIWLQVVLEGLGESYRPTISSENASSNIRADIDRPSSVEYDEDNDFRATKCEYSI